MAHCQWRSDTPPVLRLPPLVMQHVLRYLVDIPVFEWFEDPGLLDSWGRWARQLVRLLRVCRYWRQLACPLYYQHAAGCCPVGGYRPIGPARSKARIHEIAAPHLCDMVKYVRMDFDIDCLLGKKSQTNLSRALGDSVFPRVQQLIINVLKDKDPVHRHMNAIINASVSAGVPRRVAEDALPEDIQHRISSACARLRTAFPGVVAARIGVTGPMGPKWRQEAVRKFAGGMLQGRTALSVCEFTCGGYLVPQHGEGALTWIEMEAFRFCESGVLVIRRSAASLRTIILTDARPKDIQGLLRDDTGTPLVYPRLRELRLHIDNQRTGRATDFEWSDFVPFPALVRVTMAPDDSHIGDLLLRGNGASLVHVRLTLSGRTVTRLHEAGLLDGGETRPALRHIELYRPTWIRGLDPNENGPGSLRPAVFEQLVRWVLTAGCDCPWIEMRGWQMWMQLGSSGLESLMAQLGGTVRHLDLPVACTVADALRLVERLPNLNYLGIALDGCKVSGDDMPADEYVRTAVAARQCRLRLLAVAIDGAANALRQRDFDLMRALVELVPSVGVLEQRARHGRLAGGPFGLVALYHMMKAVRPSLEIKYRIPNRPWF
ncbi:hypothetical protein H4R21_000741 [Coemansia helicoidea]|uniref:Uncharacterized protein n=1 Tax=Coemansia helicoidea TaxID=1286919 RepID=A0ACC1LER3_9FUNG|nr:hypothetical protein H4R21_000741 [Coemansia helicoidea]